MHVDASFVPLEAIAERPLPDVIATGELCAVLRALGEPQRMRIFTLLYAGERCVCDIEAAVRLPQNLVSHHLRTLREAGLLQSRKDGRWMYYCINKERVAAMQPLMSDLFDASRVNDAPANC
jgi:ArsR family transcriptional regulator